MLAARLADVRRRLAELRSVEAVLENSLADCRQTGADARCPILQRLADQAGTGEGHGPVGRAGSRPRKKIAPDS